MSKKEVKDSKDGQSEIEHICGNCIHYSEAIRGGKGLCVNDIKIRPNLVNYDCKDFTLSKRVIKSKLPDTLSFLSSITGLDSVATDSLISLIKNDLPRLQKVGLNLGQEVYVNLSNPVVEYVEAYFKFKVVGYSKEYDLVQLASDDKTQLIAHLNINRILTIDQYAVIEKDLKKTKYIKIPKNKRDNLKVKYSKVEEKKLILEISEDDSTIVFMNDLEEIHEGCFLLADVAEFAPTEYYIPVASIKYEDEDLTLAVALSNEHVPDIEFKEVVNLCK